MVLPVMADHTKSDQVVQCIVAQLAPLRQMMYVQVFQRAAMLTPPPVSFERSLTK